MFCILCQIMRRMQNIHPAHVYCAGSKHKITTEIIVSANYAEMLTLFALVIQKF